MLHQNLAGTRTSQLISTAGDLATRLVTARYRFEVLKIHEWINLILAEMDSRPQDAIVVRSVRCRFAMAMTRRAQQQTN